MKAKIEIQDEVNAKIHGLDTSTRRKLNDKFSYLLPHARHVPAYKLGRWDGKVTYFTFGAQTYVALLEDIVPLLLEWGYDVSLIDNRPKYNFDLPQIEIDHFSDKTWPTGHPVEGEPIVLREYQQQVVNRFMANPMSVQEIATGAGKCVTYERELTIKCDNREFERFLLNKK